MQSDIAQHPVSRCSADPQEARQGAAPVCRDDPEADAGLQVRLPVHERGRDRRDAEGAVEPTRGTHGRRLRPSTREEKWVESTWSTTPLHVHFVDYYNRRRN